MFIDHKDYYKNLLPFSNTAYPVDIKGSILLSDHDLHIYFQIAGDISNVVLKSYNYQNLRRHNLWETTCFEAFISQKGSKEYWEVNLSSDGDWNIYHFNRYREDMKEEIKINSIKPVSTFTDEDIFLLKVSIPINSLFDLRKNSIECSLCSVIQHKDGEILYYSTHHAGEKPDFHLRDSFVLEPISVF